MTDKFEKEMIATAFITGSRRGIGAKIAHHFATNLDHRVITHSSSSAVCKENSNSDHIICNFEDPWAVKQMLLESQLQDVEILVNNASAFIKDSLDFVTVESLQKHFNIGVFTPLILSSKLPKLKHIINILDGRIMHNNDYFLSYTLAKKSLADATKTCAKVLAKSGVRVNGIALGFISRNKHQSIDIYNDLVASTPLGIQSNIDELLQCIDMLLACNSATGNIIHLDSGMHL